MSSEGAVGPLGLMLEVAWGTSERSGDSPLGCTHLAARKIEGHLMARWPFEY
jgi:hypothetical protein